jgi:hypothetical protein
MYEFLNMHDSHFKTMNPSCVGILSQTTNTSHYPVILNLILPSTKHCKLTQNRVKVQSHIIYMLT